MDCVFNARLTYSNKRKRKIPEESSCTKWSFWWENNWIQASAMDRVLSMAVPYEVGCIVDVSKEYWL
jgi:hypothetical protein